MAADPKQLAFESRRISILMEQRTDQSMSRLGLSTAQAHILLFILHHSDRGTSLTELHRAFGYSMASLCGILKRMRKNGFVRTEPCPEDDRRKLLFCTEKGAQLEPVLGRTLCEASLATYRGFSREELSELSRLQKKILANLHDIEPIKKKDQEVSAL